MMSRPAVFLDRDGTVIVDKHYLSDPEEVQLLPGAVAGLQHFRRLGFCLVLVTNQSGVGRGYFSLDDVEAVHQRLSELLSAQEVTLDGMFFCPHRPDAACDCRKPRRGLIDQACAALSIAPADSVMIGDKLCDIELGKACDMTAILVESGRTPQPGSDADAVVPDLAAAAEWIARRQAQG